MAEPNDPPIPAAIADEPQAAAMEPVDGAEAVRKLTREVDAGDMVRPAP